MQIFRYYLIISVIQWPYQKWKIPDLDQNGNDGKGQDF